MRLNIPGTGNYCIVSKEVWKRLISQDLALGITDEGEPVYMKLREKKKKKLIAVAHTTLVEHHEYYGLTRRTAGRMQHYYRTSNKLDCRPENITTDKTQSWDYKKQNTSQKILYLEQKRSVSS